MICAIILAAGESRRMGTPKLLLPFAGTTVIGHVVDQVLRSRVDQTFVVVGHEADHIATELSGRPISIAINSQYREGMFTSVRCGIRALPRQCDAIMLLLGDQPRITSGLIDEMTRAFPTAGKIILVPVYQGRRGHPILFSARYREEILTHYDDVGLRGLLLAHSDEILEFPVSFSAATSDMDNPEDYQRELAAFENDNQPSPTTRP